MARATQVAVEVDQTRLRDHVENMVAARRLETPEQGPETNDMPLTRTLVAEYLVQRFRDYGLEPITETLDLDGVVTANIHVDIPGTTRPDELILVTAHYDAWYLGADDNASGLAVLLETARILALSTPPRRTIRLVAFDREEQLLIGSARYMAAHAGDRVALVINLDSVAYADQTPGSQTSLPGIQAPDTGDFLALVGASHGRDVASTMTALSSRLPDPVHVVGLVLPGDGVYPGLGDLLRSDHAWFWEARIPALFVTDTANFRNPHYHTEGDLPETLDYDFLTRVAALVVATVAGYGDDI